jgi:hypothetical protein
MKHVSYFLILILVITCPTLCHKKRLFEYAMNVYSQFGEDGIVQKIFEVIGTESKIAVEFGAWDGIYLSNTANLWTKDIAWQAILIEGDKQRFGQLAHICAQFNGVPLCEWVGIEAHNCLEAILKRNKISCDIDLLSIDIDGNDYHIFDSLHEMRPRLIICEYNPTIPITYDLYAPYGSQNNFGTSVAALNRIAAKKRYKLVALTVTNAFYVREEDFKKFEDYETDISMLNVNDGFIVLVTTYDGKYALISNKKKNYFYGISEQFKGALMGDCVRVDGGSPTQFITPIPASYTSH